MIYKTGPMSFVAALAFSKMQEANPLYREAFVVGLPRVLDPAKPYRVIYKPATSHAQQATLADLQAEQDARAAAQMDRYEVSFGTRGPHSYDVVNTKTGNCYEVFWDGERGSCSCPHYECRLRAAEVLVCKHARIVALHLERGLVEGQGAVFGGRLAI